MIIVYLWEVLTRNVFLHFESIYKHVFLVLVFPEIHKAAVNNEESAINANMTALFSKYLEFVLL